MNRSIKKTWLRLSLSLVTAFLLAGTSAAFAGSLNEWTFEADADGLPLSSATNSGSASPPAQFSAGFSSTVFTTNGALICIGEDAGTNGMWTGGAVLDAALASSTAGVYYLRYDVSYDLSSLSNDSGTVLGVYFTGSAGNKAAGLALGYDRDNLAGATPTNRILSAVKSGLPLAGTLTAIAEVHFGASSTLKVWYGLNGSIPTNYSTPAFTNSINLTSIDNLRFHATGDFRPAGSTNDAVVDNIRMADNWADITAPIPDFSTGPAVEIVSVTRSNLRGINTGTDIGETNTVEVVIRSLNAPASNLISSVSAAAYPEYFAIALNSTPVVLTYPHCTTNTFSLIANTNALSGTYTFNVNVTADNGVYTNTVFNLAVGSLISYRTNSIAEVSGGSIPGKFEPGETLDITVFSTNNGALAVSNVVNSLYADPACFAISNLTSSAYSFMPVGAATSTVYRVTILPSATNGANWFSVTNRAGERIWADSFLLDVFKQGIPSVSPASITMNVLPGAAVTNTQVTVTNSGNAAFTFNITDTGIWDMSYAVTTGLSGVSDFVNADKVISLKAPANSSYTSTNAGVSAAAAIGFGFPFYGTVYSNFYVTADGTIGLMNTTNVPGQSLGRVSFPVTTNNLPPQCATFLGAPLIAPFWGNLASPAGSIKTIRKYDYLVISYSGVSREAKELGGTNLEFQAALFTDGRIEFRYKNIVGVTNLYGTKDVTIGLQGSASSYTNLTINPANSTSVRLTPQQDRWVACSPSGTVTVNPQSSRVVTFTANASGKAAGVSTTFNAWFNWSTGGSNAVAVSASVITAAPVYSAVSSLSFTGAAGQVAFATFVITNTGNGPLNFTISDTNNAVVDAYFGSNSAVYSWIDISKTGTTVPLIDPSPNPYITAADEGFSPMIPVGFAFLGGFPFYGGSYSQLCVSANGALRLDTTGRVTALRDLASASSLMPAQMIAPYWGDLAVDTNATIKYYSTSEQMVITWENVQQYGLGGGSNLTFQAILKPSGDITFQYKKLEGLQWPTTTIGLRDQYNTDIRYGWVKLQRSGDWSVSTNQYGMAITQYVGAVSNRAVQIRPAQIRTIGCTPAGGSIPAGSNAVITITGDASNQSDGFNSICTNTTLTITHNASTNPATLTVTFAVTNSQETVFVRAAALADGSLDSDGDGIPDEQERIAGTDPQNADSVFSPVIGRDSSGAFLSWPAPLDGVQRTYTVYFSTNLMGGWNYLGTVTNGTSYSDTAHSSAPVIYYKITVPVQ